MGLVGKYEYVLKDSSDKIYNFFINEKEQLECIYSNKSNQWIDKTIISNKACRHFAAAIDSRDKIHALVIHGSGEINYYYLEEKLWRSHKVAAINKNNENAYYPDIALVKNQLHFFYLYQNSGSRNTCKIQHITKHKDQWHHQTIEAITFNKYINPFKLLKHEDNLYLLFASYNSVCEEFYLTRLQQEDMSWEFSRRLTDISERKIYLDGLIDIYGLLHITWSMLEEDGLTVKYQQHNLSKLPKAKLLDKDTGEMGKTIDEIGQLLQEEDAVSDTSSDAEASSTPIILSDRQNCSFPYLIGFNKVLWIVWFQFNSLVSCYSTDNGKTWSTPNLIAKTKLMSFKRYRFASNAKLDMTLINCDYLFGTLYPNIQFIGFGGDINDDVPKNPQQPSGEGE